ncbi:MAG: zf-HC2 domain-containing protein [Candidatus Latescibacterota bacterium]
MVCRLVRLLLPLHVGEDLGRWAGRRVRAHLAGCPACAAQERRWRHARERLGHLAAAPPSATPTDLACCVLSSLPAQARRPVGGHLPELVRRWAVAAAVVAVAAGIATWGLRRGAGIEPNGAPMAHQPMASPAAAPVAPLTVAATPGNPATLDPYGAANGQATEARQTVAAPRSRPRRGAPSAGAAVSARPAPRAPGAMVGAWQSAAEGMASACAVAATRAHQTSAAAASADGEPGRAVTTGSVAATPDVVRLPAGVALAGESGGSPTAAPEATADLARLLRRLLRHAAEPHDRRVHCPVVESLTCPVGTQVQVELPESNTTIIWIIPRKES